MSNNPNLQTVPNDDATPEVRVRVPSVDFKTIKTVVTSFTAGVATALIAAKFLTSDSDSTEYIVIEKDAEDSTD